MQQRTVLVFMLCLSALSVLVSVPAAGQTTQRPIRMIVPQPAGGGTDLAARIIGTRLSEQLSQSVIADNRPGAGGNIGTDMIAKSPADGYTIGIATPGPFTIAGSFYADLPYAPDKAFAPITLVAQNPILMLTVPSLPVSDVKALVALARAKPGELNAAIMPSTVPHILNELFKLSAGVNLVNVPYKGGVEARNDLITGRVHMMFSVLPSGVLFTDPPKLKALAVASPRRSTLIPTVPTMREAGFPDIEAGLWTGVVAPAGTARETVERLHNALARALELREVKDQFTRIAMDTIGDGPDDFQRFLRGETAKWAKIIKTANIKPD